MNKKFYFATLGIILSVDFLNSLFRFF